MVFRITFDEIKANFCKSKNVNKNLKKILTTFFKMPRGAFEQILKKLREATR